MKKKILLFFALVSLVIGVSLGYSSSDVIKMNCNAIYPASNFHSQGVAEFAELVKQYTNGKVIIEVHPGGSLGFKGPELLKTVKDGALPMSDVLMGIVQGSEKIFGISSLPRLVNSYEEAMELYKMTKDMYDKAAAKWNQKILYVAPWPPSGLFSKKEVNKVEDIKGLKTRTYDKNGADFLANLGGSPISLPWGEVYQALQTGMIDSVLTSAVSGKDAKFWEVLKYFSPINYAYPLNMVTINLDYWNSLTKEQKEAMEKAAAEIQAKQWERSRKDNEEALKVIAENGITILKVSDEFNKELDKAAENVIENFIKEAGDDGKVIEAVIKKFKESRKK